MLIPEKVRVAIWWLTDGEFRQRFRENRRRSNRLRHARQMVSEYLHRECKDIVVAGPFHGMRYPTSLSAYAPAQKQLGIYEKELWTITEEILATCVKTIVDIGAADGYYVVGFARGMPMSKVVAFEADRRLHTPIRQLAEFNGVADRVTILGKCGPEELGLALSDIGPCIIVCDVEGAEDEILDPERVPALRQSSVLVELHEHISPGVRNRLLERFGDTHESKLISSVDRTETDWPLSSRPASLPILEAMDEMRGCIQEWVWLKCRRDSE